MYMYSMVSMAAYTSNYGTSRMNTFTYIFMYVVHLRTIYVTIKYIKLG